MKKRSSSSFSLSVCRSIFNYLIEMKLLIWSQNILDMSAMETSAPKGFEDIIKDTT